MVHIVATRSPRKRAGTMGVFYISDCSRPRTSFIRMGQSPHRGNSGKLPFSADLRRPSPAHARYADCLSEVESKEFLTCFRIASRLPPSPSPASGLRLAVAISPRGRTWCPHPRLRRWLAPAAAPAPALTAEQRRPRRPPCRRPRPLSATDRKPPHARGNLGAEGTASRQAERRADGATRRANRRPAPSAHAFRTTSRVRNSRRR